MGFLEKHRGKLPAEIRLYTGGEDNFCETKMAGATPGQFSEGASRRPWKAVILTLKT